MASHLGDEEEYRYYKSLISDNQLDNRVPVNPLNEIDLFETDEGCRPLQSTNESIIISSLSTASKCEAPFGRKDSPPFVIDSSDDIVMNSLKNLAEILIFYGFKPASSYFGLGSNNFKKFQKIHFEHAKKREEKSSKCSGPDYHSYVSGGLFDYLKCKLPAIFSWGMDQPLPDCSKFSHIDKQPYFFLVGRAFRFLRLMKSKPLREKKSFFESILYLKKGIFRPDAEMMEESVRNTFKDLTTERPVIFKTQLEYLGEEVKRTVREVFCGEKFVEKILRLPSQNAHYGYSRSNDGALGCLREKGFLPDVPVHRSICPKVIRTEQTYDLEPFTICSWSEECIQPEIPIVILNTTIDRSRRDVYKKLVRAAMEEVPDCYPVPLAEPLKVRIISKGPPLTYSVMRSLQSFLWDVLSKNPRFLINRSLSAIDLSLVNKQDDEYWISGDYKSATNELNPQLSEIAVKEISRVIGLDSDHTELFLRSMTRHIINFKPCYHQSTGVCDPRDDRPVMGPLQTAPQRWGQLMGSNVSFPILCLINAALTRFSLEGEREWSFKDCPMLINGDDVVFVGQHSDYNRWKFNTSVGGLSESVGKTYVSKDWLMMNSDMYQKSAKPEPFRVIDTNGRISSQEYDTYDRTPYVNMALLQGLKRSEGADKQKDSGSDDGSTIGARVRCLVQGFSERDSEYLVRRFIAYNRKGLPKSIPWFLPEAYGGLGLPVVGELKPSFVDVVLGNKIRSGVLPSPPCPKINNRRGNPYKTTSMYINNGRDMQNYFGTTTIETNSEKLSDHLLWCDLLNGVDCEDFETTKAWNESVTIQDAFDAKLRKTGQEYFDQLKCYESLRRYWEKSSDQRNLKNCRGGKVEDFDLLWKPNEEFISVDVVERGADISLLTDIATRNILRRSVVV